VSYLRAKVTEQNDAAVDQGFIIDPVYFQDRPDLDMNLDDEALSFIVALIAKVNDLREGEALVVWKEIF
jgi:hypothetical protein